MADSRRDPALADTVFGAGPETATVGLQPGTVFAERYRVEAPLGSGGMGAVFRVYDQRLEERVALKVVAFTHAEAARRFVEEVRLARRVTHPNVARTHDIGEHAGVPYLTMEYVDGGTLEMLLEQQGALGPRVAARIGLQLASGLEAAHDSGVIHRDLKPANVLLSRDGRALITDFGIARAAIEDAGDTGVIVGTPAYMSPEQACGVALDERSDLYSLGCILYEMVSGGLPFEAPTPMGLAVARLRGSARDVSAHVPPALASLVMRMLARDPEARPARAAEVRAALEAFRSGENATEGARRPLHVPVSPGEHALAVLPFRYRGPAEHDYLAGGLAEELIDALSRTRGLKVLAMGAAQRFADDRDPLRVGAELGIDSLVDGGVQLAGARLRLAVRLQDARHGVQLWSERLEVGVGDLFTLQESLARRVAEALRLELEVRSAERQYPSEVIESYLRARRLLRSGSHFEVEEVVRLFERCLALAPDFPAAAAAHAMAAVRACWRENARDAGAKSERARTSLERASRLAAHQPETHVAQAMVAVQAGAYTEAATALERALAIAPTLAEAHQQLALLEVEAGRPRQAEARLRLALELDARFSLSRVALARLLDLEGRDAEACALLEELLQSLGWDHPAVAVLALRMAMQRRDRAEIERWVARVQEGKAFDPDMKRFFQMLVGGIELSEAQVVSAEVDRHFGNPRFRCVTGQVRIEIYSYTGEREAALEHLSSLADGILIDTVWMDKCATLAPLRDDARFSTAAAKVRQRAADVWRLRSS